jgi:hypothetical protein
LKEINIYCGIIIIILFIRVPEHVSGLCVPELDLNIFHDRSQMKLDVVENLAISIPVKMLHQVLEGHQFWGDVF